MSILVLNAGSSTLKFAVFDDNASEELVSGLVDWAGATGPASVVVRSPGQEPQRSQLDIADHSAAVGQILKILHVPASKPGGLVSSITVVGQRVVHGGVRFRDGTLIDQRAKTEITRLAELAPLHNPPALDAIEAAEAALPGIPQVAVFDTAFFASLPESAYVYPVPYEWYSNWGVRRFGFHGISHAYCTGRAVELLGRDPAELRLVVCHLGNGCSAAAVRSGVAVATTMGFTPMEGLMMGTRSGSIDPGILLYLQRQRGLSAEQLDNVLNHSSGLLGVSGVSSDCRQVEAAARAGNEQARLALHIFADRVRSAVGALTVTLGGIDALVFTAGVGENSPSVRAAVCDGLNCLGLHLDPERNATCQPDADVATVRSQGRILVVRTREELMIAREAGRLVNA